MSGANITDLIDVGGTRAFSRRKAITAAANASPDTRGTTLMVRYCRRLVEKRARATSLHCDSKTFSTKLLLV